MVAARLVLMAPLLLALSTRALAEDPTYLLRPERNPGQTDRVEILLEVGGDVNEVAEGKVHGEKMSVVCNLVYDERTLEVPGEAAGSSRSVRHYRKATAAVKVGEDLFKPALRPNRRLIGVQVDSQASILYAPRGALTRDELELVDVVGNSLLLDRLLPERPVAVGQRWKHSEKLMANLLGLDEVAKTTVESALTQATAAHGRFEMSGHVEGAIQGVSTEIELKAKYRFDRKTRRIDWLGLLVQEQRNSSPVADGVNAVARLQMQISATTGPSELSDANLEGLPLRPAAALQRLAYQSSRGGWRLTHERCWNIYRDQGDVVVLRMLDRGELIAQCNISPLRQAAAGKEITLAEFQEEVREALGENFGQYVAASQRSSDANYRVYHVSAQGEVSELPIQWDYYLVADAQGHQVVFAVTVESRLVERLHKADDSLVGSLRFVTAETAMRVAN